MKSEEKMGFVYQLKSSEKTDLISNEMPFTVDKDAHLFKSRSDMEMNINFEKGILVSPTNGGNQWIIHLKNFYKYEKVIIKADYKIKTEPKAKIKC